MKASASSLTFYATPPHRCSYLPDREAITIFADPSHPKDAGLYSRLSQMGFRRSGEHIYVPGCEDCRACIPVRIPVEQFRPRRSQRRISARNAHLSVTEHDDIFNEAHYRLYRRYVNARHRGGGMDDPSREEYLEFLSSSWCDTVFYEFRAGTALVAVAVADRLNNGLSAVYSFFEPTMAREALGVYAILWQITEAARLGMDYCYLGYLIEQTHKMRYKAEYLPQEHFRNGSWHRVSEVKVDNPGLIGPESSESDRHR